MTGSPHPIQKEHGERCALEWPNIYLEYLVKFRAIPQVVVDAVY